MRNRLMKRIVPMVVALAIAFTTPSSSEAVLPELIVGGSALLQIGSVVVSSLPQLVAVGTGVLTLLKQGEEIASTVKRIFGIKDAPAAEPAAEPAEKAAPKSFAPISRIDFGVKDDEAKTMTESFARETIAAETPSESTGDVAALVDALVESFYQRMGLENALRALPEDSAEREAMREDYEELEAVFESRLSGLTNRIVDAASSGDLDTVRAFVEHVKGLETAGQVAVAPVFTIVLDQGRRFQDLHGGDEGNSAKAFALLEEAFAAIGG